MDSTAATPIIEEPIAIVRGQAFVTMPKDLYIPPDAMKVLLEAFEGPFDLLLYLIKKQNLDILDIPVAEVTRQYMEYVNIMREFSMELAADYLVMAAILAEIKSRMLLPRPADTEGDGEDPRAELVRRLQEYERFKQAAVSINQLPRQERDFFVANIDEGEITIERPLPQVDLKDVLAAFVDVLRRVELQAHHQVHLEALSIRDRMSYILDTLQKSEYVQFAHLFTLVEGRRGVVVTFLAMLELLKDHMIDFIQANPFGPIYIKQPTSNWQPA